MYGRRLGLAGKSCQQGHFKNKSKESTGAVPQFVSRAYPFSVAHGLKETKTPSSSPSTSIPSDFLSLFLAISDPYPDLIYFQHMTHKSTCLTITL